MEYLDGGDIPWKKQVNNDSHDEDYDNDKVDDDGAKTDPLPEPIARSIFRDLIKGIEYLHFQGIIHRDVKPANILWNREGIAKISDFGVSHCLPGLLNGPEEGLTGVASLGQTAGSPAFFAPELCGPGTDASIDPEDQQSMDRERERPAVIGKAIDVWAMGVTLYCFTFGCIPFEADSEYELLDVIPRQPVTFPTEIGRDLRDLLLRLLEKDPTRRITIDQLKVHPWVTAGESTPDWDSAVYERVQVSDQEVDSAITSFIEKIKRHIRRLSASLQSLGHRNSSGSANGGGSSGGKGGSNGSLLSGSLSKNSLTNLAKHKKLGEKRRSMPLISLDSAAGSSSNSTAASQPTESANSSQPGTPREVDPLF